MAHVGQNLPEDLLLRYETLQRDLERHLDLGDDRICLIHVFSCFPSQLRLPKQLLSSQCSSSSAPRGEPHVVYPHSHDFEQWKLETFSA